MRRVAIIGHAADKFTGETEARARRVIRGLLSGADAVVSGGCHLGGIDAWAEEEAAALGIPATVFLPENLSWSAGYKPRNLAIAADCTEAHSIVVAEYPTGYTGWKPKGDGSPFCYHCRDRRPVHVKSGGCWTVLRAEALGKPAHWHIL